MKLRLPWKLTLVFCSSVIIGLFLGYLYLNVHLKSYLDNNLQNTIKKQLILTKDFLETHLNDKGELADAQPLAIRIGKELGLRVTILDPQGVVIGDTDLTSAQLKKVENHLSRPEVQDALKNSFGASKRYSYTVKKYLLYMAVPLEKGKIAGFVRLAVPLSDIVLLQAKPQKIVGLAIAMIFLLSLGFTVLVSVYVSRPLAEMVRIAQAMAKGDFSKKPSVYSKDELGELSRALTNMSDEIKNKIERIKQEGAKFDAVLSSMFEGIIVTNEKEEIILMNPSVRKLFFIDVNPEGRKPIEVIRNSAVQDIVDKLLKDKKRLISEELIITQPEEKILKVNGVPIIRGGVLEGAVLVFHDITEVRRLEKVRQDFVANVSHEIRTPIASIKGYAETLLEGALEDKKNAREFIQIIYQDSNRLASLINDLLDLLRIESGKMKMSVLPVELAPVVERTFGILRKVIEEKTLSVNINIPRGLPRVITDEQRLAQVLLNLCDNAVKYTPEGGSIKVSAQIKDNLVQVDVIDSGVGIPEEDLPRIFERFYRVDKARSRELGGTGLGLSIVKHIVLAHGGEVWVSSVLGHGSTFSFTIPHA